MRRPLLDEEWRLIDQYARRIRSFTVPDFEQDMMSDQLIQALLSAPFSTPLLPNLRSLVWHSVTERFYPLLRALIGLNITSLELGDMSTPSALALLVFLGAQCPSLRELACDTMYNDYSEERLHAICESLHDLRGLSRLKSGFICLRELIHFASLPSLTFLDFGVLDYDYVEQYYPPPIIFSQLDRVHITATATPWLYHFLINLRFPSCRSVYIDCSDLESEEVLYDPLEIPGLILSLLECFSPALEQLHFHFDFKFLASIDDVIFADPSHAIGFDAVAPLLSFNHLIDLRLDWICTSAIDDASFKTIAQSWPQLETFLFGNGTHWAIPPSLSFIGLVHLIHHCRRLHTIGMCFCAYQVDIDSEPFSQTIPNEKITEISVGVSTIINPTDVASQLHRLLPKLTHVKFLEWLDADVDDDDDIPTLLPSQYYKEGWDRVNELLGDRNHY